jgi:hypothetical protein
MSDEIIICPKSHELVTTKECVVLRILSPVLADYFSERICSIIEECPKENSCLVFECGWRSLGSFLRNTFNEKEEKI